MIGTYHPGDSALHRAPAGVKLVVLSGLLAVLLVGRGSWVLAAVAGLTVVGFVVAGIPPGLAWTQLRPLRWFLPILVLLQGFLSGWASAALFGSALLVSVAAAALLTLTTRITALLDVIGRLVAPLRRVGVDPDRVALTLALTIRCVPLLVALVTEVDQARRARGAGRSLRALAAPVVIRALRTADEFGDALAARGFDD